MFYSEALLTKQGSPLAHVWLVGSLDKKLTRREINSTDILQSVRIIRDNEEGNFALRLEGQLLLGVSRIYNTKVKNLETDCTVAFTELKAAFKPGNVNLPGSSDLLSLLPEETENNIRRRNKAPTTVQNNVSGDNRTLLQNTLTDFTDLLPDLPMEISGDILLSQVPGGLNTRSHFTSDRLVVDDNNDDDFDSPSQFSSQLADKFDQSIEIGRRRGGLDEDEDEEVGIQEEDDDLNLNLDLDLDLDKEIEIGRGDGDDELANFNVGQDFDDGPELPPMIPDDEDGFGNVSGTPDNIDNPATPTGNDLGELVDVIGEENATTRAAAALVTELNSKKRRALRDQTTTITMPRGDSRSQVSQSQAEREEALQSILTNHPTLPANSIEYGLLSLTDNHNRLLDSIMNQYDNSLLDIRGIGEILKKKADMSSTDTNANDDANATLQQINIGGDDEYGVPIPFGGFGDDEENEEPNQKSLRIDEEGNRGDVTIDEEGLPTVPEAIYNFDDEEEDDFFEGSFFGPSTQSAEGNDENSVPSSTQPNNKGVSRNTIIAAQKLRQGLEHEESIHFSELSEGGRKSDKVKMFFEVLVLATKDAISVDQPEPFGDFNISAKPKLHNSIWDEPDLGQAQVAV